MRRLFSYLRIYQTRFLWAVNNSVINKVFDLMPPILVGWIIDTVRKETPPWIISVTGTQDSWSLALFLATLTVVIFGVESFFEWLYQSGFMRLAQDLQHSLRTDTYNQLQKRELAFFENERTGNLLAILNDDINQLERFLNTGFNQILQLLVLFVFAGSVLFYTSWELALVGMAPIPCILAGSFLYQRLIAPRYTTLREKVGQLSSRIENNLSGIKVIKSFTAEPFESNRIHDSSQAYRDANYAAIRYNALYIPLIRSFITLGFAGGILLGCYWILNGSDKLTVGELVLFSMMIQRLLWPITSLGQTLDNYERAKASAVRVFRLLDTPASITDPESPLPTTTAKGSIDIQNLSFAYTPEIPILKNLSFSIKPGQIIGVAGTTGSGKSTLIKLILRFYDPQSGAIKIDNKDIKHLRIKDLRQQIALVSQDTYLFYGTIRDNIAYGSEDTSLEAIVKAAKAAELHDFIAQLPQGYDSVVGEKGIKLSGGQRQRLSIARAILKDAPILILDEATSSVDTETERSIQQNLNKFSAGKTAIVIAHRLSTIRNADRILVLHNGTLAESGTHEQLTEKGGIYADLWKVQLGESH